jgi:hypothetical protein
MGLKAKAMAPKLSHESWGGECRKFSNSLSSILSHGILAVVMAMAWYSAFVLDLKTIGCFFACQNTMLEPRNTQ